MVQLSLGDLAARTDSRVVGDAGCMIHGVATLTGAGAGQISFLTNHRYKKLLGKTSASAVILGEEALASCPVNALVSPNPHLTFARVAAMFAPSVVAPTGVQPGAVVESSARIHPSASVAAQAVIGAEVVLAANVVIGPGCVVMAGSDIGEGSRLVANVAIYPNTVIGKRALIHAGAVIGSDGFGFANDRGAWVKIPQLGRVRIGDDVEIGACTSIDRGAIDDTVIGNGVKLDNQIQIAHNVRIGDHTAVAGCVGIAGSTVIGRHCAIAGGVGISGHLEIADGVTVTGMTFVSQSITSPGVYSSGMPMEPTAHWHKNFARFKKLDEMARRLKNLEKEFRELKSKG